MSSMGMQMLGSILALFGWIGVIIACGAPMWKVSAYIGNNIVTSETIWEGLWITCVALSTGQMQCMTYDSVLALSSDVQGARSMVVASMATGVVGLLMVFTCGKCSNFIIEEATKDKTVVAAGVVLIISGMLCLIPVSWTGSIIITDFYNPMLIDAQRRELGAALYVGWGAAILLILGGGILCIPCPPNEDNEYSVKYLLSRTSGGRTTLDSVRGDSIPTKTYI